MCSPQYKLKINYVYLDLLHETNRWTNLPSMRTTLNYERNSVVNVFPGVLIALVCDNCSKKRNAEVHPEARKRRVSGV